MGNIIFNFNCGHDEFIESLTCEKFKLSKEKFKLFNEHERLKTFDCWTHSHPKPKDLAQSGLYYSGHGDVTECAFCGVEIGSSEKDDDVMMEHEKCSPACRFISRRKTSNVPINPRELDKKLPRTSWGQTEVEHEKHAEIGKPGTRCAFELLEHERMRKYLIKYGYRIVKIETDG